MKVLLIIVLVAALVLLYLDAFLKGYKFAMERAYEMADEIIKNTIEKKENESGHCKQDTQM